MQTTEPRSDRPTSKRGPGRPSLPVAAHPRPLIRVIDGRKKVWQLLLLHEAIRQARHEVLFSRGDRAPCFKDRLFMPDFIESIWEETPDGLFPNGDNRIRLSNMTEVSKNSFVKINRNPTKLMSLLSPHRANKLLGCHLVGAGEANSKERHLKALVLPFLWPEGDQFSNRVLFRFVHVFGMVPLGSSAIDPGNGTKLSVVDKHTPQGWNDFGKDTASQGNAADVDPSQAAALNVFWAFCGRHATREEKSQHGWTDDAYGAPFEAFQEAVNAYYLAASQPGDRVLLHAEQTALFSTYEPPPRKKNAAEPEGLKKQTYEVVGTGNSAFNGALNANLNLATGALRVNGTFFPPPWAPPVTFKRLDVHVFDPKEPGVKVRSISAEGSSIPEGCRPFRRTSSDPEGHCMNISGDSTVALHDRLFAGFQIATLEGAKHPFVLHYSMTCPTSEIGLEHAQETGGSNMPNATANEIVAAYLSSHLPDMQTDWTTRPEVPIIPYGEFRFSDD